MIPRNCHLGITVMSRVAMVREKYLEDEFFSRSEKSQGILWMAREIKKGLRNQEKVREIENKWLLWQAVVRKFIYSVQEGKGCTFS